MADFIGVQGDADTLMGRVQSETLKYLYLLFSDDSVLPFDSERPPIHRAASIILIVHFIQYSCCIQH